MFTGLIEKIGCLTDTTPIEGGAVLTVGHTPWDQPLVPGDSVAVQGACLTVVRAAGTEFVCDVLAETLQRTNLGAVKRDTRLNLERAIAAGSRFGGHFVSGHVDGVGEVESLRRHGQDHTLRIHCAEKLAEEVLSKGSVACNGVSLTVTEAGARGFAVELVPYTWNRTSLRDLEAGDSVNIETDMIGKYVRKALAGAGGHGIGLDMERLRSAGFLGD
ncbi:riboflavin synthase [Verrucomicrobiota bacterium]